MKAHPEEEYPWRNFGILKIENYMLYLWFHMELGGSCYSQNSVSDLSGLKSGQLDWNWAKERGIRFWWTELGRAQSIWRTVRGTCPWNLSAELVRGTCPSNLSKEPVRVTCPRNLSQEPCLRNLSKELVRGTCLRKPPGQAVSEETLRASPKSLGQALRDWCIILWISRLISLWIFPG